MGLAAIEAQRNLIRTQLTSQGRCTIQGSLAGQFICNGIIRIKINIERVQESEITFIVLKSRATNKD